MEPLVPVVVGGLIAFVGGAIGAWIQARREHAKWTRERRYEAFITAIVLLRRVASVKDETKALLAKGSSPGPAFAEVSAKATALRAEWPEASTPLALMGPDGVDKLLGLAALALDSDDPQAVRDAEKRVIVLMRNALGLKG